MAVVDAVCAAMPEDTLYVAGEGNVDMFADARIRSPIIVMAGVADHVTLGDQVILAAQSGVHRDLAQPGMYGGSPAAPAISWKRSVSVFSKLPGLSRKIREL